MMLVNPLKQRGNVALMTAILAMLLCFCSVAALELGRLYLERENLKKLSETVALDIVANTDIFNGESVGDVTALALASIERNGYDPDAEGFTVSARRVAMEIDESGAWQIPEASSAAADHVLVELTKEIPSSLILDLQNILADDDIGDTLALNVSSIARRPLYAAFSAESRLLSLDTSTSPLLQSILEGMLGTNVDLSVVSSPGLLSDNIYIEDLIDAFVSVGDVDEIETVDSLLEVELTAVDLFSAIKEAGSDALLEDQRDALDALIGTNSDPLTGEVFKLGDILSLSSDDIPLAYLSAVPLRVDALIESAVLQVVDAVNLIDKNMLGFDLSEINVNIITPPVIAIGPPGCAHIGLPCETWRTEAVSSQIDLDLAGSIRLLELATLSFTTSIEGVQGRARLESVSRPDEGNYASAGFSAQTSLLNLSTSISADIGVENIPIPEVFCADLLGIILGPLLNLLDLLGPDGCNLDQFVRLTSDANLELGNLPAQNNLPSATLSWPTEPTVVTLPDPSQLTLPVLTDSLDAINLNVCYLEDGECASEDSGVLVEALKVLLDPLLGGLDELSQLSEVGGLLTNELGGKLSELLEPTFTALGVSANDVTIRLHGISAAPAEVIM